MTTMKELKDKIELTLLPIDFEGTYFCNSGGCAIAKAFRRQLKAVGVFISEGITMLNVGDVEYAHIRYGVWHFDRDMAKAKRSSNFRGKEPIRTIVLNRVK